MSAAFGSDGGPLPSRHFDHLPVNTNQSAVLLAAGVSAKGTKFSEYGIADTDRRSIADADPLIDC